MRILYEEGMFSTHLQQPVLEMYFNALEMHTITG